MLPSMPLLFSSSRDSITPTDNNIPAAEDKQLSQKEKKPCIAILAPNELQSFSFQSIPEDEKECDDELVLLAESSTSIGEKRKIHTQTTPTRKKKKVEAVEPMLEDRVNNNEQANHFATSYFMKAKAELDEPTFSKFISLLSDIEEKKSNVISLHSEMMELLSNYPDLAEEFIGFLHPHQALEVGKFTNYIQFEHSWNFFRKIDAFHLNKVYHLLEQHLSNPSVMSETVKSSLLSTFKGHPSISEGLLFLLPDEKPPTAHKEDFDDISDLGLEDNMWERLSIPEQSNCGCLPDKCDCACHLCVPKKFCTFCNIKFSNGQIYVQTGKGLRFAKVTFHGCQQEEVLWQLNPTIYSKPVERKRTKSLSHQTTKESSNVSEPPYKNEVIVDENRDVDKCNSTDKVDLTKQVVPARIEELVDDEGAVELVLPLVQDEVICISEGVVLEEINERNVCVVLENTVQADEEIVVNSDIKEHHSFEKEQTMEEVGVCMEIGPKEINDEEVEKVDSKMKDLKNENEKIEEEKKDKTRVWTREEDKLILQAFQKQLGTEQTFSRISDLMPNRTVDDIQGRFQVLMNLLEQMTSGSSYPS